MSDTQSISRRRFSIGMLQGASIAAASTLGLIGPANAQQVKWSAGSAKPMLALPPNACDCHHHIYDARYPAHPSATLLPGDALVADYRAFQERLGNTRNVIVQPSTYGTDNRLLVDALKAFGATARGVAVVDANVSEDELRRLHAAGVRGVRFNLSFLVGITTEMMEPVAKRIAPLGWHMQINGTADKLLAARDTLLRLPVPLVFDHVGQVPQPDGITHPGYRLLTDLLAQGRTWVKLSGAYISSKTGGPAYADTGAVACALIAAAPDRMVWGSDWPHPTKKPDDKPDDALLVDLVSQWAGSEVLRRKIFVDNPAALYGY